MSTVTKEQVIDFIKGLTLIQASELVKELEVVFGVSAAAPVAVAVAGGAAAPAAEVQTEFEVILKTAGDAKLNVIKEVRAITGLALKEAKEMVEGAPKTVKSGITKAEAEEIKKKLVAAGGSVEIK